MNSEELVKSLRAITNFYEKNPTLKVPYVNQFDVFLSEKEELVEVAKKLGTCQKGADDSYFWLKKAFGSIFVIFNVSRQVACRQVVVGHRHVEERVIPAHVEDIIEWHCDPILTSEKEQFLEEVNVGDKSTSNS